MSDDHVSLPVRVPDLTHLSNEELSALRAKISSAAKDARRKANTTIQKYPALKSPWMKTMSVKVTDPDRAEVFGTFERELLKSPEAFLAYAYVNSLFVLDAAMREEMLRRSLEPAAKKNGKKAAPPPPPPEPEEKTIDVLSAIEAIEATENAP